MISYEICLLNFQIFGKSGLKFPKILSNVEITHMPDAIDGKHVPIIKHNNGGSYFYNYRHTRSIVQYF